MSCFVALWRYWLWRPAQRLRLPRLKQPKHLYPRRPKLAYRHRQPRQLPSLQQPLPHRCRQPQRQFHRHRHTPQPRQPPQPPFLQRPLPPPRRCRQHRFHLRQHLRLPHPLCPARQARAKRQPSPSVTFPLGRLKLICLSPAPAARERPATSPGASLMRMASVWPGCDWSATMTGIVIRLSLPRAAGYTTFPSSRLRQPGTSKYSTRPISRSVRLRRSISSRWKPAGIAWIGDALIEGNG